MEKGHKNIIENPQRRVFLKQAGLAGLAVATGGVLGGCALTPNFDVDAQIAGRDFKKYDFDAIAREYETGRRQVIPVTSIDDFALSGEELGWMRLAEMGEKNLIGVFNSNPLKGTSDKWDLVKRIGGSPLCNEWLLAQYMGRTNYPVYEMSILANKFPSEEDFFKARENLKNWFNSRYSLDKEIKRTWGSNEMDPKKFKEWFLKRAPYNGEAIVFSKGKYLVSVASLMLTNYSHKQEHFSRMNLYQKKRGLDIVWSDF